MGNMTKLLLVVLAVQISFMMLGVGDWPLSSLWQFAQDPSNWAEMSFLGMIRDLFIGGLAASAILLGTAVTRSDIFIFAALAGVLLTFGMPLAELFVIISDESSNILAIILVSPIILIYVMTVIEWWRNRA